MAYGKNIVIGPAGFPDYKPLNPWGRPMPKPKRPIRGVPAEDELYTVEVRLSSGKFARVCPGVLKWVAERLCEAIGVEIAHGREKEYSNPTLVKVKNLQGA